MPTIATFLAPTLGLIVWTFVMWLWMYATRIPAMHRAKISPDSGRHRPGDLTLLPMPTQAVAANYNHLHEQPTIFYALMFFAALTGGGDSTALTLAWTYVGARVVHSVFHVVVGRIVPRFLSFVGASVVLALLLGKEVLRIWPLV